MDLDSVDVSTWSERNRLLLNVGKWDILLFIYSIGFSDAGYTLNNEHLTVLDNSLKIVSKQYSGNIILKIILCLFKKDIHPKNSWKLPRTFQKFSSNWISNSLIFTVIFMTLGNRLFNIWNYSNASIHNWILVEMTFLPFSKIFRNRIFWKITQKIDKALIELYPVCKYNFSTW